MLLLITLLAVGSMQDTLLQERMTTNLEDRNIAFEAAEAGLRRSELDVWGGAFSGPRPNSPTNWENLGAALGTSDSLDDRSANQPEHFVGPASCPPVDLEGGCPVELFQVYSRGTGGRDDTQVILRSTFGRPQ